MGSRLRSLLPENWSPECWTLRYATDRLLQTAYHWTHPNHAWLTPEANRLLTDWLTPSDLVVEFGGGRSTLFFASRVKQVVTVEGSPEWIERIRHRLSAQALSDRVEIFLDTPEVYGSLPDSVDGVLVDGGERLSHVHWAMPHVRAGGWLVVDNVNRFVPNQSRGPGSIREWESRPDLGWRDWWDSVSDWYQVWTTNGVTDTWLGRKPEAESAE